MHIPLFSKQKEKIKNLFPESLDDAAFLDSHLFTTADDEIQNYFIENKAIDKLLQNRALLREDCMDIYKGRDQSFAI